MAEVFSGTLTGFTPPATRITIMSMPLASCSNRPPAWHRWWRIRKALVILLNGSDRGVDFHLPKGKWTKLVDGNAIVVKQDGIRTDLPAQGDYYVHAGTGVVLAR